jgi:tetratricopeptide (TPR) repeat protein
MNTEVKSPPFSKEVRLEVGFLLRKLQKGQELEMPHSRPMPSHSELYDERGGAYAENGSHDMAIADINKAVELNSCNTRAYFLRGSTYLLKGKLIASTNRGVATKCFEKAVTDFTKSVELEPENKTAYQNRNLARQFLRQ